MATPAVTVATVARRQLEETPRHRLEEQVAKKRPAVPPADGQAWPRPEDDALQKKRKLTDDDNTPDPDGGNKVGAPTRSQTPLHTPPRGWESTPNGWLLLFIPEIGLHPS